MSTAVWKYFPSTATTVSISLVRQRCRSEQGLCHVHSCSLVCHLASNIIPQWSLWKTFQWCGHRGANQENTGGGVPSPESRIFEFAINYTIARYQGRLTNPQSTHPMTSVFPHFLVIKFDLHQHSQSQGNCQIRMHLKFHYGSLFAPHREIQYLHSNSNWPLRVLYALPLLSSLRASPQFLTFLILAKFTTDRWKIFCYEWGMKNYW